MEHTGIVLPMTNSVPASIEITHPEQRRGIRRDYFIADTAAALVTLPSGRTYRAATIMDPVDAGDDPVMVRMIPRTRTGRDFLNHPGEWMPMETLPADFRAQLEAGMAAADAPEATTELLDRVEATLAEAPAPYAIGDRVQLQLPGADLDAKPGTVVAVIPRTTPAGVETTDVTYRLDEPVQGYTLETTSWVGYVVPEVTAEAAQRAADLAQLDRIVAKLDTPAEAPCAQPPADDHAHCPLHGCVEYVCCIPTEQQRGVLQNPTEAAADMVTVAEASGGSIHDARDAMAEPDDTDPTRWAVAGTEPMTSGDWRRAVLAELDRIVAQSEVERLTELLRIARAEHDHEDTIQGYRDELADARRALRDIPAAPAKAPEVAPADATRELELEDEVTALALASNSSLITQDPRMVAAIQRLRAAVRAELDAERNTPKAHVAGKGWLPLAQAELENLPAEVNRVRWANVRKLEAIAAQLRELGEHVSASKVTARARHARRDVALATAELCVRAEHFDRFSGFSSTSSATIAAHMLAHLAELPA